MWRKKTFYLTSIAFFALVAILIRWRLSGDQNEMIQVRGRVFIDDKELSLSPNDFGKVWFYPDIAKGNTSPDVPLGKIEIDGTYKVFTSGREALRAAGTESRPL